MAEDNPRAVIDKFYDIECNLGYDELSCYEKGKIIHYLGVAFYSIDQELKAIDLFLRVIDSIWNDCDQVNTQEWANTIYNIGVCYQYTTQKGYAKEYIDRAIHMLEKDASCPDHILAEKYHGAGNFYQEMQDIVQAETYLQSALRLYRKIPGTKVGMFETLNRLIVLSLDFEHFESAVSYFDEALSLYQQFAEKISSSDLALIHLNAATAFIALGELTRAQQLVEKGLNLINEHDDEIIYSNALETLGIIYKKKGELAEANQFHDSVILIRSRKHIDFRHSPLSLAIAYENRCELKLDQHKYQDALADINRALHILCPNLSLDREKNPILTSRLISDHSALIRLLSIKAKIYRKQYDRQKSLNHLFKAQSVLAKLDTLVGLSVSLFNTDQSQIELLNIIASHYQSAVEICLAISRANSSPFFLEKAHQYASRSKGLILQKHLAEHKSFSSTLDKDEISQMQVLRSQIAELKETIQSAPDRSDSLHQALISTNLDLEIFHQELTTRYPEYHSIKDSYLKVPTLLQLQSKLNDQLVADFYCTADLLLTFWISRDTFFHTQTPMDESLRLALSTTISSQTKHQTPYAAEASNVIYRLLLKEGIEKAGAEVNRICFILDGPLFGLSMEALYVEKTSSRSHYFIEKYATSYALSTNFLGQNEHRSNATGNYLGYGTTYTQEFIQKLRNASLLQPNAYLTQLSRAPLEIESSAEIFSGQAIVDTAATVVHFLNHAQKARILHLSLHGLVDYERPNKSCIIFDDRSARFVLTPEVLQQCHLQAELVVLSSCHTASGKVYKGEGLSGMTRAFLYAGAKNVLSSLWSATEGTSLKILLPFLKKIKNEVPRDVALQQAKMQYLKHAPPSQSHPFYWANFILVGNHSQVISNGTPEILCGGITLLMLVIFLFHRWQHIS